MVKKCPPGTICIQNNILLIVSSIIIIILFILYFTSNLEFKNNTSQYQPIQNQRGTTNSKYVGSAVSANTAFASYDSNYNQRNNVNKTYKSRNNHGNMSLFNGDTNLEINKDENIYKQNRNTIYNGGPNLIPSSEFIGEINGIQTYDMNYNSNRLDESLLDAFKKNPYTKSLSSVA